VENVNSGEFLSVIQLAITPVILLSGVGALMLTLTNRLGRVVDRTRALAGQMRQAAAEERARPLAIVLFRSMNSRPTIRVRVVTIIPAWRRTRRWRASLSQSFQPRWGGSAISGDERPGKAISGDER
jgi:hypothetical protein